MRRYEQLYRRHTHFGDEYLYSCSSYYPRFRDVNSADPFTRSALGENLAHQFVEIGRQDSLRFDERKNHVYGQNTQSNRHRRYGAFPQDTHRFHHNHGRQWHKFPKAIAKHQERRNRQVHAGKLFGREIGNRAVSSRCPSTHKSPTRPYERNYFSPMPKRRLLAYIKNVKHGNSQPKLGAPPGHHPRVYQRNIAVDPLAKIRAIAVSLNILESAEDLKFNDLLPYKVSINGEDFYPRECSVYLKKNFFSEIKPVPLVEEGLSFRAVAQEDVFLMRHPPNIRFGLGRLSYFYAVLRLLKPESRRLVSLEHFSENDASTKTTVATVEIFTSAMSDFLRYGRRNNAVGRHREFFETNMRADDLIFRTGYTDEGWDLKSRVQLTAS